MIPQKYKADYAALNHTDKMSVLLLLEGKERPNASAEAVALAKKIQKEDVDMDTTKEVKEAEVKDLVKAENGRKEMTLADTMVLAEQLYKARYFNDIQSAAQAVAKIIKGREIGIGAMTALEKIYVVGGKTAIQAELMADMIKRSGKYNYRILTLDEKVCEIEFFEEGKPVGKSKFTLDDAKRAGVGGGMNWQKYPRNMLFARALSNGGRWYCPDAIHGAYTYEEIGMEVDATGSAITTTATYQVEGKTPEPKKAEPKKAETKTSKAVDAEVVEKSRDEILADLKAKVGMDTLKEIKKELGIAGKIADCSDAEWKKFIKKAEAK